MGFALLPRMICAFMNGKTYVDGHFESADVLVANGRVEYIGALKTENLKNLGPEVDVIDCQGLYLAPGLIDGHLHLSGGSGEDGGFSSQSSPILVSECTQGGVTTVVGTIGVDTTTKTMGDLIAKVKAFNDIGLSAYAFGGGYDIPPKTITGSIRDDLIYIKEIIGVGEIAIADRRAPEPPLHLLAQAAVDAYVGGLLTGKVGLTHFHAGGGKRRLQSVRDLLENHEILPEKISITHVERSGALFDEAVDLARKGCTIDLDCYERDFDKWYKLYRDKGGPKNKITISSDAGGPSPAELWDELRQCVTVRGLELEDLYPHFSLFPAQTLGLKHKGHLNAGADADIVVFTPKDLEIHHVMANGQFFIKNRDHVHKDKRKNRRGFNIYGYAEKKAPDQKGP